MTRLRLIASALLLLQGAVAAGQVHEGKTIVTARLVADTVRVQPGRPFTAGVHLTVAPGWHVYWENPGDTALPIAVEWEGAKTSSLRWPVPTKYQEGAGVTVFGYERETMLLATVTPPAAMSSDPLVLKARADWLVCEKLCIPGEAALDITLPVGTPAPSEDAPLIRRFAAAIPVNSGVEMRAAARKSGNQWLLTLDVDAKGRTVRRFFPRVIDGFTIDHGSIKVSGKRVDFTAEPDEPALTPGRVSGVIVTDRGSFDVSARINDKVAVRDPAVAPAATTSSAPPLVGADQPGAPPPTGDDWLAREFKTSGSSTQLSLATLLLFAALGGLLLNVMPCVLPVISLKILSFVHQARNDRRRTRLMGLMFGAGVLVSFWILVAAVAIVRASAAQIGWGFQFQSPIFVLAMSVIVLVFAMNLFGVFEITGPSFSGAFLSGEGVGGAFVHGVLATILATPCTAPFLGTAIGFAFTQPLPILFLAFTAVAIGLALPYVLLSWFPAWLRWLPRPGEWMIRFKQAMGFVLLATIIWLLSVLGGQLGPEGVTWSLVFLTIVAFSVWLIGQSRGITMRLAALALIAVGYFWALEFELKWREPIQAASESQASTSGGIRWERFSLADVQQRVERGETVFVDFTADWCWSCKVNERTVLATSGVEQRMRELNVTTVKADWTRRNPEITRLLAKFGRVGVPFYVVFPAGRLTQPIALSEVITPSSVIDALERAGPSRTRPQSNS